MCIYIYVYIYTVLRQKIRAKKQFSIYCVLYEAKSASTMFFCETKAEAKEKAEHLPCSLWGKSWSQRNISASTVFCEKQAEAEKTAEHLLCSLCCKRWSQRNSSASTVFSVRHKLRQKKRVENLLCSLWDKSWGRRNRSASTVSSVKRPKKQSSIAHIIPHIQITLTADCSNNMARHLTAFWSNFNENNPA